MGSKVFVSVVFYKHCMTELMLWIWRVLKSAVFFFILTVRCEICSIHSHMLP